MCEILACDVNSFGDSSQFHNGDGRSDGVATQHRQLPVYRKNREGDSQYTKAHENYEADLDFPLQIQT